MFSPYDCKIHTIFIDDKKIKYWYRLKTIYVKDILCFFLNLNFKLNLVTYVIVVEYISV